MKDFRSFKNAVVRLAKKAGKDVSYVPDDNALYILWEQGLTPKHVAQYGCTPAVATARLIRSTTEDNPR